jgi:hypothetical protein
MKNFDFTQRDFLSYKVQIDLNMLHPLMMNWVSGQVSSIDIVIENNRCMLW